MNIENIKKKSNLDLKEIKSRSSKSFVFKKYRRTQIAEMRPYKEGEVLSDRVSISKSDLEDGSPKSGDMIARNPVNHEDQWLIANDYFKENFEELE